MLQSASPKLLQRLAASLRERRDDILNRWKERVRQDSQMATAQGLSDSRLLNQLPLLVDQVLDSLERGGVGETSEFAVRPMATHQAQKLHPQARFSDGYPLREVMLELLHLRAVLLEVLAEAGEGLSCQSIQSIDAVLNSAIVAASTEYGSRLAFHRLEERHRLERELLRTVIDQCGDGVVMVDERAFIRLQNPEARRQIGQDVCGLSLSESAVGCPCFKPDGSPFRPEELPIFRALQGERVCGVEMKITRPDGSSRILEVTASPLTHLDGASAGAVAVMRDETASCQRKLALETSEERLRLLLTGVRDYAVFMLDPEGRVVVWNTGATNITGFEPGEILGSHFSQLYPPEQRMSDNPARYLKIAEAVGRFEHESLHQRKDERSFWASELITSVRDDAGLLRGYSVVLRDITEHMQADAALKRSEARFRRLVESNIVGTFVGNLAGNIKEANDAFLSLLGCSRRDLDSNRLQWIDLIPPEFIPREEQAIDDLLRHGVCEPFEVELFRQDGSRVPILLGAASLGTPDGEFICFVLDLSERKRYEEERSRLLAREQEARAQAEAAQQRFAFLAEANVELSKSLDFETAMQRLVEMAVPWLADWCIVHRLDEKDMLQGVAIAHADPQKTAWAQGLLSKYPQSLDADTAYARVFHTGQPELDEEISEERLISLARGMDPNFLEIVRGLGLKSCLVVPLSARGRLLGTLTLLTAESARTLGPDDQTVAEDLARRAALALDNARLYQEAQEAINALEEFLSIASHELRTPIAAMDLQIQILQRKYLGEKFAALSAETLAHVLEGLRRQARRLTTLVDNLLDLSRISAGHLELDITEINLAELVREVTDRMAEALENAGCPLTIHEAGPVIGRWDRLRLEQVLTNLLTNAIKYGAGKPIEVTVTADDSTAVVSVRDYGIGIEPDSQRTIFQRFTRVALSHRLDSLGLGLYIAHEIVLAHGGKIDVESEVGRGATFTLNLPRATR